MADRIDTNTRKRSSSSPEVVRKRRSSIFRRKSLGKQTGVQFVFYCYIQLFSFIMYLQFDKINIVMNY